MYCWSYARQWCDANEKLEQQKRKQKIALMMGEEHENNSGVVNNNGGVVRGPIFVSIGTPEKLETFLELNPCVPRDSILVDGYDHELYKNLGFGRFDEVNPARATTGGEKIDPRKLLGFANLGAGNLWNYATRFSEMVPSEGDDVDWTDLPEGGMRNGGTLVVKGDDVVYQWSDAIPSDVPVVEDVLDIARNAAAAAASADE